VQRWEYRVVSLRDGQYTSSLNEYGRDGWELVGVTPALTAPEAPERQGGGLPIPNPLGRLESAAAKLNQLGGAPDADDPGPTPLLWVLRRPLTDD
jgi:hypothetical protein